MEAAWVANRPGIAPVDENEPENRCVVLRSSRNTFVVS